MLTGCECIVFDCCCVLTSRNWKKFVFVEIMIFCCVALLLNFITQI